MAACSVLPFVPSCLFFSLIFFSEIFFVRICSSFLFAFFSDRKFSSQNYEVRWVSSLRGIQWNANIFLLSNSLSSDPPLILFAYIYLFVYFSSMRRNSRTQNTNRKTPGLRYRQVTFRTRVNECCCAMLCQAIPTGQIQFNFLTYSSFLNEEYTRADFQFY